MELPKDTGKYLSGYGIRPSVQRIAVMEYLLTHRTHPTVDEIYNALMPGIPTLSRTTVYNTLDLLVSRGAVAHITIDPRFSRYDGDTGFHGHFLCTECGALYDIPLAPCATECADGHRADSAQIYYRGTCSFCLNNKPSK